MRTVESIDPHIPGTEDSIYNEQLVQNTIAKFLITIYVLDGYLC